jgi:hypothetical protein
MRAAFIRGYLAKAAAAQFLAQQGRRQGYATGGLGAHVSHPRELYKDMTRPQAGDMLRRAAGPSTDYARAGADIEAKRAAGQMLTPDESAYMSEVDKSWLPNEAHHEEAARLAAVPMSSGHVAVYRSWQPGAV